MANKIVAYRNGLYYSKKHSQTFKAEAVGEAIGKNGLKFSIEEEQTKENVTEKELLIILSKTLKSLTKTTNFAKMGALSPLAIKMLKTIYSKEV